MSADSDIPIPPPLPPGLASPASTSVNSNSNSTLSAPFSSSSSSSASSSAAPSSSSSSSSDDRSFPIHLHDQVDAVYARLTRGRHDLKHLREYLLSRVDAERAYCSKLSKDSALPDFVDSSSLNACWKDMLSNASALGKQHEQFATTCQEMIGVLDKMILEVKTNKTKLQLNYKKICDDVKNKQQRHDKCKQIYYDAVKAAETALSNRDTGRQLNLPDKQITKLEEKARATLKEVAIQHDHYKKSVDVLQEAQTNYDATIVDILTQFEKLERARLDTVHKQMERYAVAHDFLKSSVEQMALLLHKSVAAVNIPKDVQDYIRAHDAGTKPKAHVEYVPCRSQIIEHEAETKDRVNMGNGATSGGGVGGGKLGGMPPPLPTSSSSSSAAATGSGIKPPPPPSGASSSSSPVAVALYDFESTEADDLPFKAGDVINLLAYDDAEDWWQGEMGGKVGIFPKNYVEKRDAPAPPAAAVAAPVPPPPSAPAMVTASPPGGSAVPPPPPPSAPQADGPGAASPAPQGGEGAEAPRLMDAKCQALYDFEGQDADELSFKGGQTLIITGELNGWYLGRVEGGTKVGIFPSNYVSLS